MDHERDGARELDREARERLDEDVAREEAAHLRQRLACHKARRGEGERERVAGGSEPLTMGDDDG